MLRKITVAVCALAILCVAADAALRKRLAAPRPGTLAGVVLNP